MELTEAVETIKEVAKDCSAGMQEYLNSQVGKEIFNKTIEDLSEEELEAFKDHYSVLSHGTIKSPKAYSEAVKYVTLTRIGLTDIMAYSRTFPERYAELKAKVDSGQMTHSALRSRIKNYDRNNKVVSKIKEALNIPVAVAYHDYFIRAMNVQVDIMEDDDVHARDRSYAANSLMSILNPANYFRQDEGKKDDEVAKALNIIDKLVDASDDFAKKQQKKIIEGEFTIGEVLNE